MVSRKINTNLIVEGYSPRRNSKGKEELKKSIEKEGLLDPILVRKDGNVYVIIDGNRRFRAVKELDWKVADCIISDANEERSYRISYVKNTERQNFSPIEEALHLKAVLDKYHYNVEDLVRLGYAPHRSTLDHKLSLLTLPEDIQDKITEGTIGPSHGYQLAKLPDEQSQRQFADRIIAGERVSVRELKREVESRNVQRNRKEASGTDGKYENKSIHKDKPFSLHQLQDVLNELLLTNNKSIEDIRSVSFPRKDKIAKDDITVNWIENSGDTDRLSEPRLVSAESADDYDVPEQIARRFNACENQGEGLRPVQEKDTLPTPEPCIDQDPPLNTIILGDCLEKLKDIPDNFVDLMIGDQPYGIKFMGKNWDRALPSPDVLKEYVRVLKPGSFAFLMCTPRQDCLSRMIVLLEDAGFKTNFTSLYWTYAQGFPKAHNISKAIDKKLGAKREVIEEHPLTQKGFLTKWMRMAGGITNLEIKDSKCTNMPLSLNLPQN